MIKETDSGTRRMTRHLRNNRSIKIHKVNIGLIRCNDVHFHAIFGVKRTFHKYTQKRTMYRELPIRPKARNDAGILDGPQDVGRMRDRTARRLAGIFLPETAHGRRTSRRPWNSGSERDPERRRVRQTQWQHPSPRSEQQRAEKERKSPEGLLWDYGCVYVPGTKHDGSSLIRIRVLICGFRSEVPTLDLNLMDGTRPHSKLKCQ